VRFLHIFKKYPFLTAIIISSFLFTLIGYIGKNTIYHDYSAASWKTPQLAVVFEGVSDGKYPWMLGSSSAVYVDADYNSKAFNEKEDTDISYSNSAGLDYASNTQQQVEVPVSSSTPSPIDKITNQPTDSVQTVNMPEKNVTPPDAANYNQVETQAGLGSDKDNKKDNEPKENSSSDMKNEPEPTGIVPVDNSTKASTNTDSNNVANTGMSDTKGGDKNVAVSDTSGTATPTPTDDSDTVEKSPVQFASVDEEYFNDALFIGDSRTVGLSEYSGWNHTTYYADVGLTIYDVFKREIVAEGDKKVTILDALKEQQFKKIYIMLGINELGRGTTKSFVEEYQKVINQIKDLQPNAIIFVEGIMTVSKEKSDTDPIFNNKNIREKNDALTALANNSSIFYIDVNDAITDKDGNLPAKYTFDNIHLKAAYYQIWTAFLLKHGIQ